MLLDTCAFIWLLQGGNPFPESVKREIASPSARLLVSSITACEIGIKEAKGDVETPGTHFSDDWFDQAAQDYGIEVVPVDSQIAWKSTRLPWHHRDPFDRLIIATALSRSVPVITADETFDRYTEIRRRWEG
jgi:PIN domain nuclease of toxin-antitoxin system